MARDGRWSRVLAEGAAIVVSILLAFAIQAWWEGRGEGHIRRATVEGLLADFELSQRGLTTFNGFNRRIEAGNALLIGRLDSEDEGIPVSVPDSLLVTAVNAPVFAPSRAALDAMLATGRLGLIRNQGLREALAAWLQRLDLTNAHEVLVRDIVANQVVPLLGRQTSLAEVHEKVRAWNARGDGSDYVSVDHTLRADPELVAVLAHRKFRLGFVLTGQATLLDLQEQIIQGLRKELDG